MPPYIEALYHIDHCLLAIVRSEILASGRAGYAAQDRWD
jgi:hypothetical protein